MITLGNETLPQTCLSYVAFRVAFRETLERVTLARQFDGYPLSPFGFLTEVPFLKSVAPHVQLDLLARTWHRHRAIESHEADLLDEAVVYAVCEYTAVLCEQSPQEVVRFLRHGPLDISVQVDHQLAVELRNYHLTLSNDGDFLIISQFEDLSPREARTLKNQFGLDEQRFDLMFDALGRWNVAPTFQQHLAGLLTDEERTLLDPVYVR